MCVLASYMNMNRIQICTSARDYTPASQNVSHNT